MVYLANRHRYFAHHDLEMPDQRLHFRIDLLLRRQVKMRDIHMEVAFGQVVQCIPDEFDAFTEFLLPYAEPVVGVALGPDGNDEIKIIITAVGGRHTYIVIDAGRPQVRAGKAIIEGPFGTDRADADGKSSPDGLGSLSTQGRRKR